MSIDLSLARLTKLLPYLPYTRPTIHIAGTNGKGSVSAMTTSILLAASPAYHVGRFNSPHLVSVLDCIVIDGRPVSQASYDAARKEVQDSNTTHQTQLTAFEVLTLTALRIFEKENVDIVVLEVGMGGRLDATNVVPDTCILASALTSVDLDHQAFLGGTVEAIAKEKAGIARAGKPLIVGKQNHAGVKTVAKEVVRSAGALFCDSVKVDLDEELDISWSLIDMGDDISPPPQSIKFTLQAFPTSLLHGHFPLHGAHQLDNLGTALGIFDALLCGPDNNLARSLGLKSRIFSKSITEGIKNVKWPGRLSFHVTTIPSVVPSVTKQQLVVLADGAHNAASATTLGEYIDHLFDLTSKSKLSSPSEIEIPITYILALSHSPPKTPQQTLAPLFPPAYLRTAKSKLNPKVRIALLTFTPPDGMPWIKSVPPNDVRDALKGLMPELAEHDIWVDDGNLDTQSSSNKSLENALRWAATHHLGDTEHALRLDQQVGNRSQKGLVVLAGSLYLVADFYRLIRVMDGSNADKPSD